MLGLENLLLKKKNEYSIDNDLFELKSQYVSTTDHALYFNSEPYH